MHVVLIPAGSAGDVNPFLGLGVALRERGHRATVVVNGHFRPAVERLGLEFVELGTADDFERMIRRPEMWRPLKGPIHLLRWGREYFLRRLYDVLAEISTPGETVLAAAGMALGARVAQEKLGLPLVTVGLQPMVFVSVHRSAVLPDGRRIPSWLPRWAKRLIYLGIYAMADRAYAPELNRLRRDLGLPPVRLCFDSWWHSPQLELGWFPDWFGPPQPDWPPQLRLSTFPLYDAGAAHPMPEELRRFLDAGEAPVVFTAGTAMRTGEAFFAAAVEACRRLGCRAALLTSAAEQLPAELPPEVRRFDYAPFGELFPRAAAVVHHGGVGTLSQALRAGAPQLVMPMAYDQPDNAARLEELGVSRTLPPRKFRAEAVARMLEELRGSEDVAAACRRWAARLKDAEGAAFAAACRELEALAGR